MITATGIGSGIDIDTLVSGLMDAERQPLERRISESEDKANALLTGFSTLSSSLTSLGTVVTELATASMFQATTTAATSTDAFTVSSSTSATPGSYNLSVTDIAKAQTLSSKTYSATTDVIGTGTLSLTVGSNTAVSVAVDATSNTLTGVRDAINAANAGVTASVVKDGSAYRLLLTTPTGASNTVSIAVTSDGDGADTGVGGLSALNYHAGDSQMVQRQAAQDASFSINGLPLTSSTNTITDVIDGVDLTLKQATASPVTVTVARDTNSVVAKLESFVSLYNSFHSSAKSLTKYDSATQTAGVLQGDFTAKSVLTQMRQSLSETVTGSSLSSLSAVGIQLNAKGELEFNKANFLTAWSADADAVEEFFAGSTSVTSGFADSLDGKLDAILSSTGSISSRTTLLNTELTEATAERAALEARMDKIEARYLRQFNAMDALVAELTSTGDFLSTQFDMLSGIFDKD